DLCFFLFYFELFYLFQFFIFSFPIYVFVYYSSLFLKCRLYLLTKSFLLFVMFLFSFPVFLKQIFDFVSFLVYHFSIIVIYIYLLSDSLPSFLFCVSIPFYSKYFLEILTHFYYLFYLKLSICLPFSYSIRFFVSFLSISPTSLFWFFSSILLHSVV